MKEIWLEPGESVVIRSKSEEISQIDPPIVEMELFLQIDGVKFWQSKDGDYVRFHSDLDICNDGSGPDYDDPHHQAQTAYYSGGKEGGKYLNADVDRYIVVPPQVRALLPGVVMGCRGRVTNLKTGVSEEGVVGEIGPDDTSGETAYCLAKLVNPAIGHNTGDKSRHYLYELWPDEPARDGEFTYKLQPA